MCRCNYSWQILTYTFANTITTTNVLFFLHVHNSSVTRLRMCLQLQMILSCLQLIYTLANCVSNYKSIVNAQIIMSVFYLHTSTVIRTYLSDSAVIFSVCFMVMSVGRDHWMGQVTCWMWSDSARGPSALGPCWIAHSSRECLWSLSTTDKSAILAKKRRSTVQI